VLPFHWERNLEAIEAFGVVLREHRLRAALTQEQLAFEASIRRTYVSMLELGENQPTLTMLFTLATALGCAPSDLLLEVEEKLNTVHGARKKASVGRKQSRAPSAKRLKK
jgi:transcriptional regulator with XRE-family HTH domain